MFFRFTLAAFLTSGMVLLTLVSFKTFLYAQHVKPNVSHPQIVQTSAPPPLYYPKGKPPCKCRAHRRKYDLGDVICLKTNQGYKYARCELSLNNTNWNISKQPCDTTS